MAAKSENGTFLDFNQHTVTIRTGVFGDLTHFHDPGFKPIALFRDDVFIDVARY
ncbi:hypothetical protein D3C84_1229460 [compost metagenome]